MKKEFNELMQAFAAKLGVGDLTVEGDIVALQIDAIPFGFIYDDSEEALTIVADLGLQPESADRALGSTMLKANFLYEPLRGAVIFQNPDNGAFGIEQRFRLVDLDADNLAGHVERLADLAEEWTAVVKGYGAAEAASRGRAEPSLDALGGGFIRV